MGRGRAAGLDRLAEEAGLFLVRASPRCYPLPEAALRDRVAAALQTGAAASEALRRRWPAARADEVAEALGVPVQERPTSPEGTHPSRLRLAGFRPGRGITLYQDGLAALARGLAAWLAPGARAEELAREVVVAHELFHALDRGAARSRLEGVELPPLAVARRLGYPARLLGFPFRAAIPELEEVAAHGFSTAWSRLPVPALVLHGVLAAQYDPRWAAWCRAQGLGCGAEP
ncbi:MULTISPECIES: hypothetical protein [Limnochorda]|uniref:hypothetical protein n=1 Tax=Limnochorda TaxID=1676651 RepID=UPI0017DCE6B6|nr:hypothetical protein [Limnochorda pilosa]MBO2487187.1 hypothetical protein [Bacillota bacterium]MBO2519475.1 hypothetical protein [Bacillota bacterium]NMA71877.1 hypothetical protein [Bacillota bacterium]